MITQASAISDDFINAKIRGMRSKLIEAERLMALTDCRSLHELFRRIYPSETFEGHALFQREIVADNVRSLWHIRQYLSGHIHDLFTKLVMRYQLENLKVILRAHAAGMNLAAVEPLLVPLPKELALPAELFFDSPDPRRFIDSLQDAEWRAILSDYLKPSEHLNVFKCEIALDNAYWSEVIALSGKVGERARQLVTHDAAMHVILMVLRARFDFGLDNDQLNALTAGPRKYINKKTFDGLISSPDLAAAIKTIPAHLLPADNARGILSLTDLEDAMLLHQYRLAVRIFVESVLDVSAVVAFYYIKRAELSNLIRLSEGVRHSLPREVIESHLLVKAS